MYYFYFFILPSRRHNLPESPPDSEPPYSPADGVGQSPRKTDDFIKCVSIAIVKILVSKNSIALSYFLFFISRSKNAEFAMSHFGQ